MELVPPKIASLRHPQYSANLQNWLKWRLAYQGGTQFMRTYLKRFSKREDNQEFEQRLAVSYVPAFAKGALNEIKNSIFERMCDISRSNGPNSYQDAILGCSGGVDNKGSSMNAYFGREVLPELLSMGRVGIYVDMPPLPETPTKLDTIGKRPYLYWYKTEDILCWADQRDETREFSAILLQDTIHAYDKTFNMPSGLVNRVRYVWVGDDGYVHVKFFNADSEPTDAYGNSVNEDYQIDLKIRKIPFVLFQLGDSLLADIADYQIALMNLASSDISYALKSNFPFYTEQIDWRAQSPHLKQNPPGQGISNEPVMRPYTNGMTAIVNQEKVTEIRVGVASGRQYPVGTERPGFIHPSSEPLAISMQKQEQLKAEIRQLVALSVVSLSSKMASAESKAADNQGLESGLACIGLELEHGESKIAEYWAAYEGAQCATVQYPDSYQLLTDEDRQKQSDHLVKMLPAINSVTYQKEVAKRLARTELGNKVPTETLRKIESEIDGAKVVVSDPEVIASDIENGLVSLETASVARGYPKGEVEKAKDDHAERLARIATAQATGQGAGAAAGIGQARGVSDLGADPKAGKSEKTQSRDTTKDPVVKDKTRGEGQ